MVSARKVEGSVLGAWALQDAWVHLHGERREELRGFTREERRIDRVHMPTQALHHLRSVYTVATPADHKAVVAQLGPVEDPPMILAAVFSQNSKSCIFSTAISNCTQ